MGALFLRQLGAGEKAYGYSRERGIAGELERDLVRGRGRADITGWLFALLLQRQPFGIPQYEVDSIIDHQRSPGASAGHIQQVDFILSISC